MQVVQRKNNRSKMLALASIAGLAIVSTSMAQTVDAGQISISTAGSTALKNWFVAKTTTFTDVQPGTQLAVDGISYPSSLSYWNTNASYQLAPKNNTTTSSQDAAIQFTYHESGSVEGIYELANDQIYTNSDYAPSTGIASTSVPYVTANIDRNPEGGNAVWLNYNQIGASGITAGTNFNATTGATPAGGNGLTLGNFYAPGVGQASTPGATTIWTPGSPSNPTPDFNQAGINQSGGQNAVQVAVSDAVPEQVFANDYGNNTNTYTPAGGTAKTVTGTNNSSFNSDPLDLGYGEGNAALSTAQLGTAGSRAVYQSSSVLNMPANAQNPRAPQGTTFGVGAWNTAGLGNLNSQLVAVTATTFVANPGTGLQKVDRTDADWLQLTGRFANGASFNMTTRDVNSGTRDVAALDTGIDPTYASGKNDEGNGNLPDAVSNSAFDQESIGPAQRFSNKTAGGAQLRPTIQNNRMAVGTLAITDANSHDTATNSNPVRVLAYSDSANGSSGYVSPDYSTITNGTYVIYQNEQLVTLKAPGANYANNTVVTNSNGAATIQGSIQGDDASGDVAALLNQATDSVATANAPSPANPADGLLSQGYLIPQLMQVEKNINGQGLVNSTAGAIDTGSIVSQSNLPSAGGSFNQSLYNAYTGAGGYSSTLPVLTSQEPTTGSGSTYGGAGGSFAVSGAVFNGGAISITNNNYLFGNFNQNGDRDFNAVKSALSADVALISADQAVGASVDGSEFTSVADNNLNYNGASIAGGTNGVSNTTPIIYTDALGVIHTNLTKGDLIVMGDFNGDGHFDGADLVAMAEGASLSDSTSTDRLTSSATMYQGGVLNKNAAMDYLQSATSTPTAANEYIRQSGRSILEAASVPFGASPVINAVSHTQVIDPVSGLMEFSYDPTGANTFNKSDVNDDGVVDFNDAVLVDNSNGQDYSNVADQVQATQPAPITGTAIPFNLVMAKQSDGSTVIGASDVAVVNSALTGSGNTNWYGYNVQKTGPSTIDWARTGGTVTVYPGAGFEISKGTVQISGTEDPFTDNNAAGGGSTAGNHVAVTVDGGAKLQDIQNFQTLAVAGLKINTASNSVLDLGNNTLIINYGNAANDPISSIQAYLASGFNGGAWNGAAGITSSAVTDPSHYGIAYADSADPGNPAQLGSDQIEITYTLLGDANLDHAVNGTDFAIMASNFNKAATAWDQGDFNYDNAVNGTDFALMASNFNQGTGSADVSTSDLAALDSFAAANGFLADVPEPATLSLIAVVSVGMLGRRRRRN